MQVAQEYRGKPASSGSAASGGNGVSERVSTEPVSEKDMPIVRMFYPLLNIPNDINLVEEKLNELTMKKSKSR